MRKNEIKALLQDLESCVGQISITVNSETVSVYSIETTNEIKEILIKYIHQSNVNTNEPKNNQIIGINLEKLKAHYWDKLNDISNDPDQRDEDDTIFWEEFGHQKDAIVDIEFIGET